MIRYLLNDDVVIQTNRRLEGQQNIKGSRLLYFQALKSTTKFDEKTSGRSQQRKSQIASYYFKFNDLHLSLDYFSPLQDRNRLYE